jgi:hypothetical protein
MYCSINCSELWRKFMCEQLYRIPRKQSNGAASWHPLANELRMFPVLPNT